MVLYEWKTQRVDIQVSLKKKDAMLKTGQKSNSSHGKRSERKERILNNGENKHKQKKAFKKLHTI